MWLEAQIADGGSARLVGRSGTYCRLTGLVRREGLSTNFTVNYQAPSHPEATDHNTAKFSIGTKTRPPTLASTTTIPHLDGVPFASFLWHHSLIHSQPCTSLFLGRRRALRIQHIDALAPVEHQFKHG